MCRADAERAVGMDWYATKGEPCQARAKESAEDFKVEEELDLGGLSMEERPGHFPLYKVEKKGVDSLHMAEEMSAALRSRVSYAGLKDKRADAVQYVTPTSLRSARPPLVVGKSFTARLVGYLPGPVSREEAKGNRFDVVLRGCCARVGDAIEEAFRTAGERRVPNYYGLQRFGASGVGTHRIGRAIVRGEFEQAVSMMLLEERKGDGDMAEEARERLREGRYEEGARLLPPGMDVEKRVARSLERRRGDWVGAVRAVPIRLRRLYVQAYQSLIFNKTLSLALARGEDISAFRRGDNWSEPGPDGLATRRVMGVRDEPKAGAVPMVQLAGYAFRDYGSRFDACLAEVLTEEGVRPGRFYVEEMQEVSGEGGFRRPHMAVGGASWNVSGETARLRFTLARGGYATVLLREVMKPEDPGSVGLG